MTQVVLSSVLKKRDIPLTAVLDEEELDALVAKVCEKNNIPAVDAAYKIDGNKMTVTPAVDGVEVDEKALREQVLERFNSGSNQDIVMSTREAHAIRLDIDEVYAKVHTQVADAYMTDEDGAHKIVPHVVGIDFDLEAAREKLEENPAEPEHIMTKWGVGYYFKV